MTVVARNSATSRSRPEPEHRGGTPAIAALTAAGVAFRALEFAHEPGARNYGLAAAAALQVDPDRVFKTLVATTSGRDVRARHDIEHVVAIVPVSGQLSLRGLATAVGAKRAEMCAADVAERITGYVVGGISPFGQRTRLATVIDETCALWDTVFVSGGRRGLDVEIAPELLITLLDATVAPIASA
jgi:Cys-tRNA(Pro)/Cys-tRNA(Cys) deacylase